MANHDTVTPTEKALCSRASQSEMESECLVKIGEKTRVEFADACTEAVEGNGADLFGLRFGVSLESSDRGREQHLEWVQTCDVRSDGDDREDAASESSGGRVGAIIADDYRWASFVGFGTSNGIEIDETDLAALHQPSPSGRAVSQASDSSLASQSDHASS